MVSEPAWQEVIGSNLNHPSFKVEYLAPRMRRVCVASTLLAQGSRDGVRVHVRIYHISEVLTISLNFWLSWFFDNKRKSAANK